MLRALPRDVREKVSVENVVTRVERETESNLSLSTEDPCVVVS